MHPHGGHIGSEDDGLGPKQPELFDIHVMIFAGDPETTIEGLVRHFAIDQSAAERLVNEVPVVVKRAADPEVAAEMMDVLGELGAQVVLLPAASAVPPETDILELKAPSEPPAASHAALDGAPDVRGELDLEQDDDSDESVRDGGPAHGSPAHGGQAGGGGEWSDGARERHARARGAATWGGLDHNPQRAPVQRAPEQRAGTQRAPTQRAASEDLLSRAPMAELDLELPGAGNEPAAAWASSSTSLARKALQAADAIPATPRTVRIAPASLSPERGVETDDGLVIAPLYEPHEREQARARPARDERALGHSVPPAPFGGGESAAPPSARPVGRADAPRTVLLHAAPPTDLGLGSVPPLPDLGLGVVPRLPLMPAGQLPPIPVAAPRGKGRVGPPPRPSQAGLEAASPKSALRPAPAAESQRGLYERTLEGEGGLKLPSLTAVQATESRAAARPAQADGYWSGRRAGAAAEASDAGISADSDTSPSAASQVGSNANAAARPNPAARPTERSSTVVAIGGPLLEIVAGLAVFALGVAQDSSILFGNASVLSVLLHAVALYGIGAGVWGLRG